MTVWRNFESTQLYKICNKCGGKCLGVVGGSTTSGANIEQRTYAGAAGQTWKVLQVSLGVYKIINKTSGMSLDVNGTQVVQRPYASQAFPITYLSGPAGLHEPEDVVEPGRRLLEQLVEHRRWPDPDTPTRYTADRAKWTITAVALDTFDPGMTYRLTPQQATNMAIDVCNNGATNNGNCVEQFAWWNGNGQKFFIGDAGKGNVKLAMKLNKNKCLGPRANLTTNGTPIEVQDCAAPGTTNYNQAWITAQKNDRPASSSSGTPPTRTCAWT